MKQFQTVKRSVKLLAAAATATVASGSVDLKDADYATIELALGKGPNTNAAAVVVKVQEADVDEATSYVDISTVTAQASITLSTAAEQVHAFHVNQDGTRKRFVRLFATPGTVATNSAVALTAIANVQADQYPAGTTGQADGVTIV